jgi:hypothetical protein
VKWRPFLRLCPPGRMSVVRLNRAVAVFLEIGGPAA